MSSDSSDIETGQFDSFASSLILNVVLLVVVVVAFWILRAFRANKFFFAPQYYDSEDKGNDVEVLPAPGKTPWDFCKRVLQFPEERILHLRGLDSVMYLRMLKLMLQLFAMYPKYFTHIYSRPKLLLIPHMFVPLGCGLLLPINATANSGESGIPSISLSNIPRNSPRMWAHVITAVIFDSMACWLMYRTYQGYLDLRVYWMKRDRAHNYTVMFKGVSTLDLSQPPRQYFSQLFPNGEIVNAHYALDNKPIRDLISERKKLSKKLEHARAALENTGNRPTHRLTPVVGHKVDSIRQYEDEIAAHTRQIESQYSRLLEHPKYAHVAFATFRTISSASVNSQIVMDRNIYGLKSLRAPEAADIYWERLNRSRTIGSITFGLTWVLVFALKMVGPNIVRYDTCATSLWATPKQFAQSDSVARDEETIFLWSIPIVFIQGIANLENLTKLSAFHWLNGVLNWTPVARGLIQQFLPALFTIIFLALVPNLIVVIVKFKGVYTKSEVNRGLFKIYFLFLLFNVFLVSLWAGGISFVEFFMI